MVQCTRCNGQMVLDNDARELSCIQCGNVVYLPINRSLSIDDGGKIEGAIMAVECARDAEVERYQHAENCGNSYAMGRVSVTRMNDEAVGVARFWDMIANLDGDGSGQ